MRVISEIKSSLLSSVECKGSWLAVSNGGNVVMVCCQARGFFCVMGDEWVVRLGWPSTAEQKLAAVIIKGHSGSVVTVP